MLEISVLAEFERAGLKYDWAADGEIKIRCPFHNDNSPSCNVHVEKRVFRCPACQEQGSVIKLLARHLKTSQAVLLADLATRYSHDTDKTIPPETIERYHAQIWRATALLQELYKRGLTDEDIREFRLGEHDGRITIPVPNKSGHFVMLRKYLPGAPGKEKMRNLKGYSAPQLFPVSQLKYDTILVTGGECKAIAAKRQLNRHGIGALTACAGEGAWQPAFTQELKGKRVIVCLDVDSHGQRAANTLAMQIRIAADWVGNLALPLDLDRYPKGDINDFIAAGGDLFPLVADCPEFVPSVTGPNYADASEPTELELTAAMHASNTARRVRLTATVSTMDTVPYSIPKSLSIACEKNAGNECSLCPVFNKEQREFTINPESPAILDLVSNARSAQLEIVKSAVGIPRSCKVCEFVAKESYNVEDARLSPQIEINPKSKANGVTDRTMQPAYCIGDKLNANESYVFTGRMFPHPRTQQATLLISSYKPSQDALSNYTVTNPEDLGVFWPDGEWSTEAIDAKLKHIYTDFAANVTRIYQRDDIHLYVDLTYHSPLGFEFDGKFTKGWVESLIVGDSAQGKSEVACGHDGNGGLRKHFGLGARVDSKNLTVAGLIGGVDDAGNRRQFISWGVLPTNDRQLLIIEELKGSNVEILAKTTDCRSSGIAEIPKIKKGKTYSRVRLIINSNPRSSLRMHQYSFGLQAAVELIGNPEDLRRFDWVLIVSEAELNESTINMLQKHRPSVPHVYNSDLCRRLVLWAWTRTTEQVHFTEEAQARILQGATDLCEMFTQAVPICDKGSMRYKIARLAAACAARTFSCSEDYESIIVQWGHADYIIKTLQRIYSSSTFGYLDYTRAMQVTQTLLDPQAVRDKINETSFPKDLCENLLAATKIDLHDLQDWCAMDRENGLQLLSLLVRKHCLMREGRNHYRKTGQFISLLREMLDRNQCVMRPSHVPRGF